jgi:hypothetical protein
MKYHFGGVTILLTTKGTEGLIACLFWIRYFCNF